MTFFVQEEIDLSFLKKVPSKSESMIEMCSIKTVFFHKDYLYFLLVTLLCFLVFGEVNARK